ncbi:N-acetylmuramoyl-L-alanine amidase [Pendulispora rubella]|uniref:N-acetylmuramoyl-L-alanine amidase n=1 Tax=Pendulispora rubella TaxID=2741070 RepID=A0ABZ2KQF6_9BACT
MRMSSRSFLLVTLLVASACATACTAPEDANTGEVTPQALQDSRKSFDAMFEDAAREFNVPANLLKAIAYTETRMEMVRGEQEFEGRPPAFGVMALRGDNLARGAKLAGVTPEKAQSDPRANIRAGAAVLASLADEAGLADRADVGAWAPLAVKLGDITNAEAQSHYIHREVYELIRRGEPAAGIAPTEGVRPQFAEIRSAVEAAGPDYPASIWRPSPNYGSRPSGDIGDPGMIVIHTCEGGYSGCWSWLTNSESQVSAHYVVNESGSEVSQLVRESNRAWHVAATYKCSLNSSVECWRNGYSVNHFSVGIEHGGFASQSSFPAGQIDASAKLSCDISRDQAIPRDRFHIIAHGQLQPENRVDPGPNWPWTSYISKINAFCGSAGGEIIVDSDNANNDTTKGKIEVSSEWATGSATSGYYGSGYLYASTTDTADKATFSFYLPAAATKTVDAWWVAGTNRTTTAPFVAIDANGNTVATVNANQQANGGKWNTLGSWSFPAGWNKIELRRSAAEGSVVIADAVRIR